MSALAIVVQLSFDRLPYLEPLLAVYETQNQQPDNLCGPYWISLLLQAYGEMDVSPVDVAIAAATLLPGRGDPAGWLPPGATSLLGHGYQTIPTVPEVEICGTSIQGLMRAVDRLSGDRFCLIPFQAADWEKGIASLWALCRAQPSWQAVPLLNLHTGYLQKTYPSLSESLAHLQAESAPSRPDWQVGHFALLTGALSGQAAGCQQDFIAGKSAFVLLDTYPSLGQQGQHLQPLAAIAQSLHRPSHATQGGIALFVESCFQADVEAIALSQNLKISHWDNGTPDRSSQSLSS